MKYACLYSIVRFAPFAETEEFANIGIVLTAPAVARMEYRLARKNFGRVNRFFECPDLFAKAMEVAEAELDQVKVFTLGATEAQIASHFRFLTEAKESLVRFSPMRPIMVTDFATTLSELYGRYIERQLNDLPRCEAKMVMDIRQLFKAVEINSFHDTTLMGELARLHLPLVHHAEESVAAIKPLAFDQAEPSNILAHCDGWLAKLERANEERLIQYENVLMPITFPSNETSERHKKAAQKATESIRKRGILWVDISQHAEITGFARRFVS